MPEWSTYSLDDFVMFSARTYDRLFELHHRALWPAQIVALAAGIALLVLLRGGESGRRRAATWLVAAAWLAVAWSFLWIRLASIQTGGRAMAVAFGVQSVLLARVGTRLRDARAAPATSAAQRIGVALVVFAVAGEPLVGRLLGRPWTQAEIFAVTPDATVAATVGLLLCAPRARWYLWPVPVAWSVFSGATRIALHAPEWWLAPAIAASGMALEVVKRRSSARALAAPGPPDTP